MTDLTKVITWQHPGSWSNDPTNILKHLNAIAAGILGNGSPVVLAFVLSAGHQGKGDISLSLSPQPGETEGGDFHPTVILCHQGNGFFHLLGDPQAVDLVLQALNQRFS